MKKTHSIINDIIHDVHHEMKRPYIMYNVASFDTSSVSIQDVHK